MGYCATCNNTGFIDCHCGGDLCVCGEEEIECPECGNGFADDDDYEEGFDADEWNNTPPASVWVADIEGERDHIGEDGDQSGTHAGSRHKDNRHS